MSRGTVVAAIGRTRWDVRDTRRSNTSSMAGGAMVDVSASVPVTETRPETVRSRVLVGVSGADVGLLVLRLGVGVVLLGHGLQKLGWFKGGGYPSSISAQKQFLAIFGYSS